MSLSQYVNKNLVLDGGCGTYLEQLWEKKLKEKEIKHEKEDKNKEDILWSSKYLYTNSDLVYQVHSDFLKSGSNVIRTNTYQAFVEGFVDAFDLSVEESLQLFHKSVEICKSAIVDNHEILKNRNVFIGGSVGPFGAPLKSEFTGTYLPSISLEELKNWHRPRIEQLLKAEVDFLALESMPGIKEMTALVELLKEFPSSKAWLSFSTHDGVHLVDGNDIVEVSKLANTSDQILGVGVNCVCPQESVVSILQELSTTLNPNKTVICYPNSFESWSPESGWFWAENYSGVQNYSEACLQWMNAGARWIGGCCRVTPTNIQQIAVQMNSTNDGL